MNGGGDMSKFKIGDEIVGLESSKKRYALTCKGQGYGIVRDISDNGEIVVELIVDEKGLFPRGSFNVWLEECYFKLKEKNG